MAVAPPGIPHISTPAHCLDALPNSPKKTTPNSNPQNIPRDHPMADTSGNPGVLHPGTKHRCKVSRSNRHCLGWALEELPSQKQVWGGFFLKKYSSIRSSPSKVRGSIAGFMGGGESVIAIVHTGHTLPLIIVILESQSLLGGFRQTFGCQHSE